MVGMEMAMAMITFVAMAMVTVVVIWMEMEMEMEMEMVKRCMVAMCIAKVFVVGFDGTDIKVKEQSLENLMKYV